MQKKQRELLRLKTEGMGLIDVLILRIA